MSTNITRRTVIRSILATSAAAACPNLFASTGTKKGKMASVAKYVHPKMSWTYAELNEFLDVLPDEGIVNLQKSLQMITHDSKTRSIKNRKAANVGIQEQLLWISSNVVAYPFGDEKRIDYHNLVKWVGDDIGVDQWILDSQPTFVIERAIQEKLFVDIWDKMNHKQRQQVLRKIDTNRSLSNHAAVASLSGAGALAALSMTVHLAGFAFYTTMSTVICTVAGFFGVTLPFAVYTSASSVAAFLSGPVGWALLAIAAAAGVTLAGRANARKTAAAICQIHSMKVAALVEADLAVPEVFQALGDPLKRQLVGRWRYVNKSESIELSLESDGAFTAKSVKVAKSGKGEVLWRGKGQWSVREKKFTVKRDFVFKYGISWSDGQTLLDQTTVRRVSQTAVELTNGQRLLRL